MPKYTVIVHYEQKRTLTVHARDEIAAEEKAVRIVEEWDGVLCAEAEGVEEEE